MIGYLVSLFKGATEEKYNRAWDEFLNKAIDEGKVTFEGPHVALFDGVPVWVANYPYASAKPYDGPEVYPSRATIERVNDAMIEAFIRRKVKK